LYIALYVVKTRIHKENPVFMRFYHFVDDNKKVSEKVQ